MAARDMVRSAAAKYRNKTKNKAAKYLFETLNKLNDFIHVRRLTVIEKNVIFFHMLFSLSAEEFCLQFIVVAGVVGGLG